MPQNKAHNEITKREQDKMISYGEITQDIKQAQSVHEHVVPGMTSSGRLC